MNFLKNIRKRRVRGAELVVTGGLTLFLGSFATFLAPVTLCGYGLYRWLFKKSYPDGITSIAVGIISVLLLSGPLSFIPTLLLSLGGILAVIGAIMMVFPGKKDTSEIQ